MRHGHFHQAQQAQMAQAIEVGQILFTAVDISHLGLDLEALVAGQVQVPQLRVRIPVPVIVPVGDVVLESIVPCVDGAQLLEPAQLGRQRLEFVAVNKEDAQLLQMLKIVGRQGAQTVRRHIQFLQLGHRDERTGRHLVQLIHRDIQDFELMKVHEHSKHIVRKSVIRDAHAHQRARQRHIGRFGYGQRTEYIGAGIEGLQAVAVP